MTLKEKMLVTPAAQEAQIVGKWIRNQVHTLTKQEKEEEEMHDVPLDTYKPIWSYTNFQDFWCSQSSELQLQ